jgi:hypothetical protein
MTIIQQQPTISLSSTSAATTTSTRALSRKTRVYAFRDFLIQFYGDYLLHGRPKRVQYPFFGHVLDVAGGKGDLSWLLSNVDKIPSVVLDPRGDVSKCAIPKSVQYLKNHPQEAKQRAIPGLPTHQPLAVLMPQLTGKEEFTLPQHLPLSLDQEMVDKIRSIVDQKEDACKEWQIFWKDKIKRQQCQTDGTAHLNTNTAIIDASNALQIILGTALVVGFHPDQATDYCIDLAQVLEVPFCVVPCCVFPSEFPNRILRDTTDRVQSYPQLIQYLKEKCPQAETAWLNFHFAENAKNLVLYTAVPQGDIFHPRSLHSPGRPFSEC